MTELDRFRAEIRAFTLKPEAQLAPELMARARLSVDQRSAIGERALQLVDRLRKGKSSGLMETFLAEYGLSSQEGVALMRLTEALLRVPDPETADALIEDKLAGGQWQAHMGKSRSKLVNASTLALMVTRRVLDERYPGTSHTLSSAMKRLGEPVIRTAVEQALKLMGHQFVLGRTIEEALGRAAPREGRGYLYSYDMLGEAAVTFADATRYFNHYRDALTAIAKSATGTDVRANPGISVKLSALYPRYETMQRERVLTELVPRVRTLAQLAASAGLGMNVDAEEAGRLDLSLDVIEAVLGEPTLANWDGFGVVVQAYGRRTLPVIDWLNALAKKHDRRLMVRLVKGAYWDTEIKIAQTQGLESYPVFTRKSLTDVSFLAAARQLLDARERLYPQFATHNAHTIAAILEMASPDTAFEFQRLHGMGEAVHEIIRQQTGRPCRIYAPVGAHRDLLAYLVRRLLENGANSSFVNQIVDERLSDAEIAADPLAEIEGLSPQDIANPLIPPPPELYGSNRKNARGWNIEDPVDLLAIEQARQPYLTKKWTAEPMLAVDWTGMPPAQTANPANPKDHPGTVIEIRPEEAKAAIAAARTWQATSTERAQILHKAANLYEDNAAEFFALAAREAGKTLLDAVAELREAVDFLRYYANEAETLSGSARGTFGCISPWNFPLAIFTGQVAAALATGNAVLAKPAETTPLIAAMAVRLLHKAGVPRTALQFVPGKGREIGAILSSTPGIDGIAFTGSLATAHRIEQAMADHLDPDAVLIAETGGINAMIVDSTALPEQAIKDILASAFQSAGQRCSALRVLYVQEDIAETFIPMLKGAMDTLVLGDPIHVLTDIGPVIDKAARQKIDRHIDEAGQAKRVLHHLPVPQGGIFVGPALIKVSGIEEVREEIFGPVLHLATFKPEQIGRVTEAIAAADYGLTFGLHTRVDRRVKEFSARMPMGNIYVNRNQIGAIVGSQPFGGEGLSGTGPKAGGPHYLLRFIDAERPRHPAKPAKPAPQAMVANAIKDVSPAPRQEPLTIKSLPGITGESNEWRTYARGLVLCLGPGLEAANEQANDARTAGCSALTICAGGEVDGTLDPQALEQLEGFAAVAFWGPAEAARAYRQALARRPGAILPLILTRETPERYMLERHVCINTTASGGNTQLLAEAGTKRFQTEQKTGT